MSWERLARPKKLGGQGVKNIFYFGQALAAKSLWRSLFLAGLWSVVIKEEYLKRRLIVDWIRSSNKNTISMKEYMVDPCQN